MVSPGSSGAVHVAAVPDPVHEDGPILVVDLVHDSGVTSTSCKRHR